MNKKELHKFNNRFNSFVLAFEQLKKAQHRNSIDKSFNSFALAFERLKKDQHRNKY